MAQVSLLSELISELKLSRAKSTFRRWTVKAAVLQMATTCRSIRDAFDRLQMAESECHLPTDANLKTE